MANGLRIEEIGHVWLQQVLNTSTSPRQVRIRYFQNAWIVSRRYSSSELQRAFDSRYPVAQPSPVGEFVTLIPGVGLDGAEAVTKAANFASLSNVDRIGETTITSFIESNAEIVTRGLGGLDCLFQVDLPWLVDPPPGTNERSVKPDFLLLGPDGKAHIGEFKLPLLGKHRLTVRTGSRRGMDASVGEGLDQLSHYREYFDHQEHRAMLTDRFRIELADRPRLILVVGSYENFHSEEVRQAMRSRDSDYEIVDYDTLRALYLIASDASAH